MSRHDDPIKTFFLIWCVAALVGLAVWGVVIWAIIALVTHFTA